MERIESKESIKPPPPLPPAGESQRDVLHHLEAYLARRDGVDKLLKISRYAAKIALASSLAPDSLSPRFRAFESSVGLSRKAFRLGKFVQDLNALRVAAAAPTPSSADRLLYAAAYGGEGVYYFVEQLVWLSKAGLISPARSKTFQKISAWAELVGYAGSIALKAGELKRIRSALDSKSADREEEAAEIWGLRKKLLLKRLSVVQDLADALMALADVREGKGLFTAPLLLASAGLLSALISTHKNWCSC